MNNNIEELSEELFQELKKRVNDMKLAYGVLKALEELGEVADLAMRAESYQRKHKKISDEELNKRLVKEICDVIIPLVMISKSRNINIFDELKQVMKHEIKRWKDEDNSS